MLKSGVKALLIPETLPKELIHMFQPRTNIAKLVGVNWTIKWFYQVVVVVESPFIGTVNTHK